MPLSAFLHKPGLSLRPGRRRVLVSECPCTLVEAGALQYKWLFGVAGSWKPVRDWLALACKYRFQGDIGAGLRACSASSHSLLERSRCGRPSHRRPAGGGLREADQDSQPFRWSFKGHEDDEGEEETDPPQRWESSFCETDRPCDGVDVEDEEVDSILFGDPMRALRAWR